MNVSNGMNRTDLDRLLVSLGGSVEHLRRTGEVAYSHPSIASRPRANGRRKDAPRHLTAFVRRVAAVTMLATASTAASADVCEHVNRLTTATKAAAAGLVTETAMAAGPLTPVLHSSGSYILTGASGYVAKTLGFVGTAWAVATAPATLLVTGTAVASGAGLVLVCRQINGDR